MVKTPVIVSSIYFIIIQELIVQSRVVNKSCAFIPAREHSLCIKRITYV